MEENRHACAVVLGGLGLLIEGPAGAGKSMLMLRLVDEARARGSFAAIIADDRTLLAAVSGRLVARAPSVLGGLAEWHGLGIFAERSVGAAVIDGLVRMVPDSARERLPEPGAEPRCGIVLPAAFVPAGDSARAALLARRFLAALRP